MQRRMWSGRAADSGGKVRATIVLARTSQRYRSPLRYIGHALVVLVAFGFLAAPAQNAQPSDLVAAYAFDEGSGPSVADLSGNGNVGALDEASWTSSGKFGSALSFNGWRARASVCPTQRRWI